MLVATALLGMIAGVLFFSLDQVSRATAGALGKATTYQDVRTLVDQMSRELQQAIPYVYENAGDTNCIFIGRCNWPNTGNPLTDAQLHFVATIDNNTGYEEVEVHYAYDGTNALWKSLTYYGGTNSNSSWDFNTAAAFDNGSPGIAAGTWGRSPTPYDTDSYAPVLFGVKAVHLEFSASTNAAAFIENWLGHREVLPGFVRVTVVTFDSVVLRRWGSANFVPSTLNHLARTNQFLVQIPRTSD